MLGKAEVLRSGVRVLGRRLEWPGAQKDPFQTVEAERERPLRAVCKGLSHYPGVSRASKPWGETVVPLSV